MVIMGSKVGQMRPEQQQVEHMVTFLIFKNILWDEGENMCNVAVSQAFQI